MKLLLPTLAGSLLTLALAADPLRDCSASSPKLNGANFPLIESGDNTNIAALRSLLPVVTVSQILDSGNHKVTKVTSSSNPKPGGTWVDAYKWSATSDFNDFGTLKWVPQGISGTWDAYDSGTVEGRKAWVVSWHNADDTSVRVTFVDRQTLKYRHVLLVEPKKKDGQVTFDAIPAHAGGIMWYGDTLWVVDTWKGIRVFDMKNIWKVSAGDGVGRTSSGTFTAQNYAYVIPQVRTYKPNYTTDAKMRFSFIHLDRTTAPDSIVVAEYNSASTAPNRVVRWPLDYTTRKLKKDAQGSSVTSANFAYCHDILRVQGVMSVNGKYYLGRSNGANNGDMWAWIPGSSARNNVGFLPAGTEDLSYNKDGGEFYTASEHPNQRYIVVMKTSAVLFN